MKIVFWGTPKYAAENLTSIVTAGYNVIAVVTQPDRKRGRGKKLSPSPVKKVALDIGIPVYETQSISKDQITKNLLFNLKADVYLVVAFGQILPKEILDQPQLGCWNSHASLLPLWRGAAPIQWSIINDDLKTGVCIMAMEEGLDTGPIIEKQSTDINDGDNLEILTNRLSKISSSLLIKSLNNISLTKGLNKDQRIRTLKAIDQSELIGNTSYARQIQKRDYLIDWNQNSRKIFKTIQGLYPNAYTFYKSKRIKILKVSLIHKVNLKTLKDVEFKLSKDMSPGQIIDIKKQYGIFIMTNDYPLLINIGQLEGKKESDSITLSTQSCLKINDILGS